MSKPRKQKKSESSDLSDVPFDELIGTREASRILGVTPVRVQIFAREERLRTLRRDDRWWFSRQDVIEFSKQERPTGRPKESND